MIELDLTTIVLAFALLALFSRGLTAGMVVGSWNVSGGFFPAASGYATTVIILAFTVLISVIRDRKNSNYRQTIFMLPFLLFGGSIWLREFLGGDFRSTWAAIGVPILIGLAVIIIGSARKNIPSLIWGFAIPNLMFSLAEVLRVLEGGTLHLGTVALGANPIYAAHFVGLSILSVAALAVARPAHKKLALPVIFILLIGFFITLSRGPIVALGLAVVSWIVLNSRSVNKQQVARKVVLLGGVVVAAIFAYIVLQGGRGALGDEINISIRQEIQGEALDILAMNPILGQGTDWLYRSTPIDRVSPIDYPHNIFLEAWVTYGIIPFLLLGSGIVLLLVKLSAAGKAIVLYGVACFSASGTLTASLNFWVILAFGVICSVLFDRKSEERSAGWRGSSSPRKLAGEHDLESIARG